jgi:hypothetical protein
LHFLQALALRDRDGANLPLTELDFDHDGRVSLLEAHVRAGIVAQSIDVPTTTSERYLRAVQHKQEFEDASLVPELGVMIVRLGAELGLGTEAEVRSRWTQADGELAALDSKLDSADQTVQARLGELSGRLLARWPVLDDAYHPDFSAMLAKDRTQIGQALDTWPEALQLAAEQRRYDELDGTYQRLELQEAKLMRLLRAHETLGLAAALRRRAGPQWAHYRELLTCERYVPTR